MITRIRRHGKLLALGILALAAGLGIWWTPALAQSGGWTTPMLIFEGPGLVRRLNRELEGIA